MQKLEKWKSLSLLSYEFQIIVLLGSQICNICFIGVIIIICIDATMCLDQYHLEVPAKTIHNVT